MSGIELLLTRDIELPRAIVWDAVVDPELVVGWLGAARIDQAIGGRFEVDWLHPTDRRPLRGVIVELVEARLLVLRLGADRLELRLDELEGGLRGTSTRLSLRVEQEGDVASIRASWLTDLDQLEELLHGHPVDWAYWERDRGAAWADYRDDADEG